MLVHSAPEAANDSEAPNSIIVGSLSIDMASGCASLMVIIGRCGSLSVSDELRVYGDRGRGPGPTRPIDCGGLSISSLVRGTDAATDEVSLLWSPEQLRVGGPCPWAPPLLAWLRVGGPRDA